MSDCYARYVISSFSTSLTKIEKAEEEETKTREERSQAAPDGPGSRKWYKIMKRSNGTCWTSRGAVGRPRRCRQSRTRANGSERNDPSKDEERSSATVKRAQHLSRTYVLLARLMHLLSCVPFGPFSFLLLIRPVPHYSRILWFSPGNVYLRDSYSLIQTVSPDLR